MADGCMGSRQIAHRSASTGKAGGVSRERSESRGVVGGVSSITVTMEAAPCTSPRRAAAEAGPGGVWAGELRRVGGEVSRERLDMPTCNVKTLIDTAVVTSSTSNPQEAVFRPHN